jgi:hypothetical protein
MVNVVEPDIGTCRQSSLVKRTNRAVGQSVALSPLDFQVNLTVSPGSASAGLTLKAMISGLGGASVLGGPFVERAVVIGIGVEVRNGL